MMTTDTTRFHHVRLATGVKLHWAESGRRRGEPLLFLHGWPDSWFTFSRVWAHLPIGQRALAIDQRGFGESDHPDSGYAISELADDVLAFLDAADLDRVTLVGHSYGSFVARCFAIAHPECVSRLVLIGTGVPAANPVLRELQTTLAELPDPIPREFAREFQASTAYRPLPPEFFERIVDESLKIPSPLWRVMIDRLLEYDDAARLGEIRAPTLLLWGERDALFSRADQHRFLEALPSATLTVYEETGHCPNWERPERVARDIDAFVRDR
jgi:non-heme chloroperoxidase